MASRSRAPRRPVPTRDPARASDRLRSRLESAARRVAVRAYAPYSQFRVGAAVMTERGVFVGCNVENASYGLCLCAERSALAGARAAGARRIRAIAVVCLDATEALGPEGRSPCGACRQWMLELAPDAAVYLGGVAGTLRVPDLLPHGFRLGTQGAPSPDVVDPTR